MAIRNILEKNNPALRKHCRPVDQITDRIVQLVEDMKETMLAADGAGLAAPQVGVLRRIVVLYDIEAEKIIELINPEILSREGSQYGLEGCLSCPGEWGLAERPMNVVARGLNAKGEEVEVKGEGLLARAICHEVDHLEGILFIDHAKLVDIEEYEKEQEAIAKKEGKR